MAIQQHQIKAGFNQTLDPDVDNIENIVPTGYYRGFPTVQSNLPRRSWVVNLFYDSNGGIQELGSKVHLWTCAPGTMTVYHYSYLYNTILSGAYYGDVTIYTTAEHSLSTYAKYNAVLDITQPTELEFDSLGLTINEFVWTFRNLEAI